MEHISALPQQLLQILSDITARDVNALNAVGHGEALVDGDGVRDAVAGVEDDAGRAAAGVEGEHGLDGGVDGGDVKGLEEDLGGCVAVLAGVERWFS